MFKHQRELPKYVNKKLIDMKIERDKSTIIIGGDFPGGPAGKTLRSHCMGPGFDPWSGN